VAMVECVVAVIHGLVLHFFEAIMVSRHMLVLLIYARL